MAKFRSIQNAMYNKIDKLAGGLNPSRTDMVAFARKELDRINAAQVAGGKTQLSPFRERLESIVNNKLQNAPFSAMKDLRASLLAQARDNTQILSGPERGFLTKMAGLIDQSIENELKRSRIQGLPELWRSANSITREEHELFEKKLIENLAAKKNPEDIALVLRGNSPGAISQIGIQETRDAMSVIPKQMIPRVQKQILLDTIYEATGKGTKPFDEKMFAKKILQIGDERGSVLFGSNWPNIKQFSELLNRITESGGLTAAGLANPGLLNQMGRLSAEAVATFAGVHAAHGPGLTAAAVPIVGEAALWKTVAAAMTHPEAAARILKIMQVLARTVPYAFAASANAGRGEKIGKGETPDERRLDDVRKMGEELKKKVTPTTGPQSSLPSNPKDMMAQARALQDMFHQSGLAPAPTPAEGTPGPQSSLRPTHRFDEQSGSIVALV
jgi:hypothetical protein